MAITQFVQLQLQRYALIEPRQKVARKIAEQSSRFPAPTFRLTHKQTHCLFSLSTGRGSNRLNESFFSRSVTQCVTFLNYFVMKIYSIKPEGAQKPSLTASREAAVYAMNYYHDMGIRATIDEYDVMTQGKNYNNFASPQKLSNPKTININKLHKK